VATLALPCCQLHCSLLAPPGANGAQRRGHSDTCRRRIGPGDNLLYSFSTYCSSAVFLWAVPRRCAHCAPGDARELQGGRGKNISAEESENFLAKDKFLGSGERGRGERGPAADRIILIVVHVIVIWSLVVARIP